jgi:hypothetical protein
MSAYVKGLIAETEADATRRAERKQSETAKARQRLAPLEQRVARLLATIPDEIQREGLSIASLQESLRGKWRGQAHAGQLGMALRKLGFWRERKWRSGEGFRALWHKS